jgi:hypothetical protein
MEIANIKEEIQLAPLIKTVLPTIHSRKDGIFDISWCGINQASII